MTPHDACLKALSATHMLTAEQIERYFELTLDDVASLPNVVSYAGCVWWKPNFSKARQLRHRALIAEIYCRLLPADVAWSMPSHRKAPAADAVLMPTAGDPIYIEADTGKETHTQWSTKLLTYHAVDGRLWIVAEGGPLRLQRLRQWVVDADLPIAWTVTAIDAVTSVLPEFVGPGIPENPESHEDSTEHEFRLDGQTTAAHRVQVLEGEGRIREHSRKLHHRLIVHYYVSIPWPQRLLKSLGALLIQRARRR